MTKVRVAINGFGRIGRAVFRIADKSEKIEIVAINDLTDPKTLAHLLKYDSVHGVWDHEVKAGEASISVDGKEIMIIAEKDPSKLPWKELNVDAVLECTGLFTERAKADLHIQAGAKKVLISAPAKGEDLTVVLGVNDSLYDKQKHNVISNASCTTNCLAPITHVINKHFKIKHGFMTTIHSYTNDQRILDLPHKDLRRARAGALSMIPTTTGAAKAIGLVIPELKGKLDGISIRVPTPNVSVVDVVFVVEKETTAEEINKLMKEYAEGPMKGILRYCDEPLVSKDFNGDPHSSILDAKNTAVMQGTMIKLLSWYDNEWGYSNRMYDVLTKLF
ncbi:MAG TPA: type I glyceraldehyde-3-phosphate dehydrogenase [bacterium]|mgnify:CR=1 FL=1|nr:type I glyceraldehyde-3-phosphate dehydrogenase [bacterium]MDX9804960.1 type I glyceraldehyde-3-phosphate dehydrogenase [bacterium]HNW15158.1 type I glyceraldehyde-3-phosphate dehydrogenase [bacterium]HNZ54282.1 type I glyceraldehyde-3-phosphate dehydrogenase [bacterium]HOG43341.1 type I glyceraldehyde-3-phosphate dehydrogenase [bacterium]